MTADELTQILVSLCSRERIKEVFEMTGIKGLICFEDLEKVIHLYESLQEETSVLL
jgi:hypothetical protein